MTSRQHHIFVSYSHADRNWLKRLRVHLRPLVRDGAIELWDDSRITTGDDWRDEITKALLRAQVAVLLLSADFLASDFIAENELPPLLERASNDGVLILPIVVGPCLLDSNKLLSRYQCSNPPDQPLAAMKKHESEAILVSIARDVAEHLKAAESSEHWKREFFEHRLESKLEKPSADHQAVQRPINLGFDGPVKQGMPFGWFNSVGYVSYVSEAYAVRVSRRHDAASAGSFVTLEKAPAETREFGSLMQRFPCRFLAGRTIRFEGELCSENVSEWAGLWVRADGRVYPNLFFDNMSGRPITGTTSWSRYFIDALLPEDSEWLNYGIVLAGSGQLSADNLCLSTWNGDGHWEEI